MKIKPKSWILLIEKIKNSQFKEDFVMEDDAEDKKLIVWRVLSTSGEVYEKWTLVVFGKYSIFKLTYRGDEYFFIDEEDVISVIE